MYADKSDPTARNAVTKNDPRVTRVGRIIRKTSIDELPQFFNSLLGSLSLVGPRPHAVSAQSHNKLYHEAIATIDDAKRRELSFEMQRIDYNEGGLIIPFFPPVIDGYGANVHGLVPSKGGLSLNAYDFKRLWLS